MYSGTPPILPPKPLGSGDVSRISTPALSQSVSASQSPRPQPTPPSEAAHAHAGDLHTVSSGPSAQARIAPSQQVPDPGEQWLPRFLEDKSYVSPCPAPPLVFFPLRFRRTRHIKGKKERTTKD